MQADLVAAAQIEIQGRRYEKVHIYSSSMAAHTALQGITTEPKLVL